MRTFLRFVVTLLLAIAVAWMGLEAWFTVAGSLSTSGILASLAIVPLNIALNAWPALLLVGLAVVLSAIYRRLPTPGNAS